MSVIQSENSGHRATCLTAEVTRQVAVAGASQSAVKTADLAFLKTAAKSAISSGLSPAQFLIGLRELGHFGIVQIHRGEESAYCDWKFELRCRGDCC